MIFNRKTLLSAVAAATLLITGGCSTPKDVAYFQDLSTPTVVQTIQEQPIRLRPQDKISIVVHSKDPSLSILFNMPIATQRIGQGSNSTGSLTSVGGASNQSDGMSSYTVDPQGNITFPVLGSLHVEGMTRYELAAFIKGELMGRDLVKDPTVTVEFLNTGFSVIGSVKKPGRYDLNRDQITILDAVAQAGDLDINGRRDNIRVLRQENGKTQVYIIDITNGKELMNSPAYYLRQNDIVYVEPNDLEKRQTTVNGTTSLSASFWISVVSVCSSLAVLVVNLVK